MGPIDQATLDLYVTGRMDGDYSITTAIIEAAIAHDHQNPDGPRAMDQLHAAADTTMPGATA